VGEQKQQPTKVFNPFALPFYMMSLVSLSSEVVVLKISPLHGAGASALVLEGREAILEHSALLEELADRCDQTGTMCALSHFLDAAPTRKFPRLFLLLYPGASPSALCCNDVRAAVLVFEHRLFGMPTGIFATDGYNGFRTVIAREPERRAVAVTVARLLLERGAHIVKISGEGRQESTESITTQMEGCDVFWARREREFRYVFQLATTFEETLASLGKSTRFNLRYYRRRLLRRMPCEVVTDVRGQISRQQLEWLNANSLNPIPLPEFLKRYDDLCKLPGGYLFGVREASGKWLGLVAGWRQGETTVLHWQLNVRGYEKDSLINVMRSYFLQHEVEHGARRLVIHGGTAHSMVHSFDVYPAFDLVVRRRSFRSALICLCVRLHSFISSRPPKEGLFTLLSDDSLHWSHLPSHTPQLASRKRRTA